MSRRPPASIIVTVASAAALALLALAVAVMNVAPSHTASENIQAFVSPFLACGWLLLFVANTLRRKRSGRAFAIALSLTGAAFTLCVTLFATYYGPWTLALLFGAWTALSAALGSSLLRSSAREWLSE